MASLTHVCMWTEHGWKRVTADEVSHLHPGGTVSARSGIFMCELCGQYVTLTNGSIRDNMKKIKIVRKELLHLGLRLLFLRMIMGCRLESMWFHLIVLN